MLMIAAFDAQYAASDSISGRTSCLEDCKVLTGARPGHYPELTRDVDNGASLFGMLVKRVLPQHVPQLSAATEPRTLVVYGVEAIEMVGSHFYCFDNVAAEDSCTIDAVVEPFELGKRFVVERVHEFFISHIAWSVENLGRRVNAEYGILCLVQGLWVDVGDCDPRATGACEAFGDSCTNACMPHM